MTRAGAGILAVLFLVMTAHAAWGDIIDCVTVTLTATAQELAGQEPDNFSLQFDCDNPDVRIVESVFDLRWCVSDYYWDVEGPNSYGPVLVPPNTAAVSYWDAEDNSPRLVCLFSDFEPGQKLVFQADIDGTDCSVFDPGGFTGAEFEALLDLNPVQPGAGYQWVTVAFDGSLQTSAEPQEVVVLPEPATLGLALGGLALIRLRTKRRRGRRAR